jgi:hypothetical protein
METESSLPCSKRVNIVPDTDQDVPNPQRLNLFLEDKF